MLKQPNFFYSQPSTLPKDAPAKFYFSTAFGLSFMIRSVARTQSSTFYALSITNIGNGDLKSQADNSFQGNQLNYQLLSIRFMWTMVCQKVKFLSHSYLWILTSYYIIFITKKRLFNSRHRIKKFHGREKNYGECRRALKPLVTSSPLFCKIE